MKLRYSATSPYVRKVNVLALEIGIDDKLERIATMPADPASGLNKDNPLNKIPALILDDGSNLYDSSVICEYLDHLYGANRFHPGAGKARWNALKRQALADGILDAAVLRVMENRRPENLRSADWHKRQKLKMDQGIAALEGDIEDIKSHWDIGTLTVAILLDYLDFRFPDENWRSIAPKLAAWHKDISAKPSLKATYPKD